MVIASYRDAFLAAQGVAVATRPRRQRHRRRRLGRRPPDPRRGARLAGGQPLAIRRPEAIRPWQHVLEPLAGYLTLADKLWQQPGLAGAYNFGPATAEAATVREVVELARSAYGRGRLQLWQRADDGPHEAGWLAWRSPRPRAAGRAAALAAGRGGAPHHALVSGAGARAPMPAAAVRGGHCDAYEAAA